MFCEFWYLGLACSQRKWNNVLAILSHNIYMSTTSSSFSSWWFQLVPNYFLVRYNSSTMSHFLFAFRGYKLSSHFSSYISSECYYVWFIYSSASLWSIILHYSQTSIHCNQSLCSFFYGWLCMYVFRIIFAAPLRTLVSDLFSRLRLSTM